VATLPSTLDLSALAGPRPAPIQGTIETSPELRMRLHRNPGANGGRGAWIADFHTPGGTPVLLGRRVVLCADLFSGHHVPVADVPVDRVFRVRRTETARDLVVDGELVTVNLRGIDPALFDLGSGAVVIEVDVG
jgi:hypothetical protein